MQANWSLVLNILLLIMVIVAIGRLIKTRRQQISPINEQPSVGEIANSGYDDIISVRKVHQTLGNAMDEPPKIIPEITPQVTQTPVVETGSSVSLMMFLLAKENRQLAGYELLQTVLAAGLRFGEGQLFHRHQFPNGQGPVLCSLAAATPSGTFDLQNIGGFSVRGLCLFMELSNNPAIDQERFAIMLETAKQLSEGLDTYLLDEDRKPLSEASLSRYHSLINQAI